LNEKDEGQEAVLPCSSEDYKRKWGGGVWGGVGVGGGLFWGEDGGIVRGGGRVFGGVWEFCMKKGQSVCNAPKPPWKSVNINMRPAVRLRGEHLQMS